MAAHSDVILRALSGLDRLAAEHGAHPIGPWWQDTLEEFYQSGRRSLVLRVGRRGGKSSTFCRIAVCEALYGAHSVPKGEVGIVGIVSVRREEAADRLRSISSLLDILHAPYRTKGDTIELQEAPIIFRVMSASLGGVVGGTRICGILDEVSRWKDADTGSNPAAMIIESVRPTLATMPNARLIISSSPLGIHDAHFDLVEMGDTPQQMVRIAPTWVANPSITEATTRALEPDEQAWAREFAAIPQAESDSSLLSAMLLDRARRTTETIPPEPHHWYVACIDPATRGNAWTLVVATRTADDVRTVVLATEWRGSRAAPLSPGRVFAEIRTLLEPYRIKTVHSDQFAADALRDIARLHNIYLLTEQPWTAGLKADAYEHLKTLLQERKLSLPPDPTVRADLLGIRLRITRGGVSYELASQQGRHSDYAPAIAMAMLEARMRAVRVPELTPAEQAERVKVTFLESRARDRKRAERFGPLPVTHRGRR